MGNKYLDGTALTIAIIGAVNWGLIGLFRFDLVAFLFGDMSWFSRIVYVLVGISGLYIISLFVSSISKIVISNFEYSTGICTPSLQIRSRS